MTIEEKGKAFAELFLIRDFADFLSFKRNKLDFMDTPNSYGMLLTALTDADIIAIQAANVKFGMIIAPAVQMTLPVQSSEINLLCFEKHCLNLFNKSEVVAIILHEIGHVFNPNLTGDEQEFRADDFAVDRGYTDSIVSSLRKGIDSNLPGFNQGINERRIARLAELVN